MNARPHDHARSPVIVVAGMHRSGTSFVASLIAGLGVSMGHRQLEADAQNPRGYFEDLDVLHLNQRMLTTCAPADDGGYPDWGWTEHDRLDRTRFADFAADAAALVEARRAGGEPWGFKDPRTTVTLDFWDPILGHDARYIFVYRFPWEVADSMQRLGADLFLLRPDYAYPLWEFYNRQGLAFARRHPDRCVIVSANALVREPRRLVDVLRSRGVIDAPDSDLSSLLDESLFRVYGASDPIAGLALAAHPATAAILAELEAAADLPSGEALPASGLRAPRPSASPAVSIVIPCRDQGEFLLEAIASVERSIDVLYELLIANDGSTDASTLAILEVLRGAGYSIIDQENRGLGATRNLLISKALAPAVIPLDADNRLRPGFIKPALARLDSAPDIAAVYGDRIDFGLSSGEVHVGEFDADRLRCGNYIDACALLRARAWFECGGYDEALPTPGLEDWDLWLSCIDRGWRLEYWPQPAFEYRLRPNSMLRGFDDPEKRAATHGYILGKHATAFLDRFRRVWESERHGEARITDLTASVSALTTSNEALIRDRDWLAGEVTIIRDIQERLGAGPDAERAETRRLRDELAQARTEARRLYAEASAAGEEHARLGGDLGNVQTDHARARAQLESLQHEAEAIRARLRASEHENRLRQSTIDWLVDDAAAIRTAHARAREELTASRRHIEVMEQTKMWRARVRLLRLLGRSSKR